MVRKDSTFSRLIFNFPAGASWQQVTVNADGRLVTTSNVFTGGASATLAIDNQTLVDIPLVVRCGLDN